MASSHRDSLFFSIPILCLLLPFTCLVVLATASTTVLSKNGGSLALFLILKGVHSVFYH